MREAASAVKSTESPAASRRVCEVFRTGSSTVEGLRPDAAAFTFDLPRNQLDDIKAVCGAFLALVR